MPKSKDSQLPYRRPTAGDTKVVDLPMPEVMREAATAALYLHLAGKKALPIRIWRCIRSSSDEKEAPRWFCSMVWSNTFQYLLLAISPAASGKRFTVQDVWDAIAQLASLRLLEKLVTQADKMEAAELRRIAKDFTDQAEMARQAHAEEVEVERMSEQIGQSPTEQAEQLRDNLNRLPESMREKVIKQWRLDELHRQQEMAKVLSQCQD